VAWAQRVECPFILFKGKPRLKCSDMKIDIHILQKYAIGDIEVVVNPIGRYDNGIWYSLYTSAEYSLEPLPGSDGKNAAPITASIDRTGVISFNADRQVMVKVKYRDLVKTVKVSNPNPPPPPKLKPDPEKKEKVKTVKDSGK
jgi:hypothetical protein